MNLFRNRAVPAAFVALVTGGRTGKQTENLLTEAGFKKVPATTAEQQAHLKTLPRGKVTMVQRDSEEYFTYPDAPHKMLYVGEEAEYKEYQKLRQQKRMPDEPLESAQINDSGPFSVWGGWGGGHWR